MKTLCVFVVLGFLLFVRAQTPKPNPDNGIFTVECAGLTIQRSDPIVNPGVPGSHVHSIIGGNAFRRTMPGRFAENSTATTCDKALDHSNYWVPSMYHYRADKMYELVTWNHGKIYYLRRACNYDPNLNRCDGDKANPRQLAFPYGFRMVAGDPARRTQNNTDFAQKAVTIVCLGGNQPEKPGFPQGKCDTIRAQVFFPSCWNGKDLDSPDHRSHTAYPYKGDFNGGVCPQSHPIALMSLFYEFLFDTKQYTDWNRFAFSCGDATGYGFHGDFIMGWTNRDILQDAHMYCAGNPDTGNCPTLGKQGYKNQPLMYPAIYEEQIGLNGPIPSLPGNNPVVWPSN